MPVPLPPTVTAPIDFLDPSLPDKPYSCLGAPPPNMAATNIEPYPIEVEISDLRGIEGYKEEFVVDKSGFQVSAVSAQGSGLSGPLSPLSGRAEG